jgi:hypothetical protein
MLVFVALPLSLLLVPVAVGQSQENTRPLRATIHMSIIGQNGERGSRFAGELVGRPLGTAALLFRNTISGSTSQGKAVLYTKRGTIRATATNELQPQPDGSVNLPGSFRITGGTGRYKGASGRGTFDGVLPANSSVFEVKVKGKIRY